MAQTVMIVFLIIMIGFTALDPAMAASKKRKSKADQELEKSLQPITTDLTPLSQKSQSRGLFSPEDMSKALDLKLQLLDLIRDNPTNPMLIKPAYEAGRLFRAREMYDDAFDFFNYIQTNFASSPYAAQAKVEIQRMKQKLGDDYFSDPAVSGKPVGASH